MKLVVFSLLFALGARGADVVQLFPGNTHYFSYRGKPTVLIGSTEHYGAVLNLDFNYNAYLDALRRDGLNLTRVFSGTYREVPGSFNIAENTLAPQKGKYACPFARTEETGNYDEGTKFDLTKFDPAYFERLHDFLNAAAARGVVVEYTLFCTLYGDGMWDANPFNAANNVNGVGKCPRREVYTLQHDDVTAAQDAFVRKAVEELADVDNIYFEICNEPYFENVRPEWQAHVAKIIGDAERKHKVKHVVAQNVANNRFKIVTPDANVSAFNFHYATPPITVGENYALNRPVVDDETGFAGKDDATYRTEAWDFLIAGGAGFDHLDYSFTVKHPTGDLTTWDAPGGGGAELRHQLGVLKRFLDGFDIAAMSPHDELIQGGAVQTALTPGSPAKVKALTVRLLAEPGKQYAAYVRGGGLSELQLDLPAGEYEMAWVDPTTGRNRLLETIKHTGGVHSLPAPSYGRDVALRLVRK